MRLLAFPVLLLPLVTAILQAQVAPAGALVGDVTDSSGAAIARAPVSLVNSGTLARKDTVTGDDGHFAFHLLPAGDYRIKVTAPGFAAYEQTGIRINVDSTPRIGVVLQVGSIADQVTVAADAAMVSTESGTLSQVVRERYIEDLPLNGRISTSPEIRRR